MTRSLASVGVLLLVVAGCAGKVRLPAVPGPGPEVRVRVAAGDTLSITAGAAWSIAEVGADAAPRVVHADQVWRFAHASDGRVVVIDPTGSRLGVSGRPLDFATRGAGHLRVGGRAYRGRLRLVAMPEDLVLVNVLPLESYVLGVVGNEIGKGRPETLEALKAQAVAARTYAYRRLQGPRKGRWDLVSTTGDQVYTGISGESALVAQAVRETAGELIVKDGSPVPAYYSSTCGGRTSDPDEVWTGRAGNHLKSRSDRGSKGDWCKTSKYHRWQAEWSGESFMRIFSANYPRVTGRAGPFGELKKIHVRKRGKSKRVRLLEVETTTGTYPIEKDAIRWILRLDQKGSPGLRSTRVDFDVKRKRGRAVKVIAEGRGFGHGVGMCQWGALEMSKAGKRYETILKHYYHKVKVRRVY